MDLNLINIYSGLKELFSDEKRITIYNTGISDKEEVISFLDGGTGSRIGNDGNLKIKTVFIYKLELEKVTFLKLDIEGNEIQALNGAAETIKRDKPKLAICVYHKIDDIWRIPLYIKNLVPEYKIYIRHHRKNSCFETVCYATL